jgi:hypothetical protein
VPKAESDAILSFLFHQISENTDHQVRFKWQPNSIAIWDNRVCAIDLRACVVSHNYHPIYRSLLTLPHLISGPPLVMHYELLLMVRSRPQLPTLSETPAVLRRIVSSKSGSRWVLKSPLLKLMVYRVHVDTMTKRPDRSRKFCNYKKCIEHLISTICTWHSIRCSYHFQLSLIHISSLFVPHSCQRLRYCRLERRAKRQSITSTMSLSRSLT